MKVFMTLWFALFFPPFGEKNSTFFISEAYFIAENSEYIGVHLESRGDIKIMAKVNKCNELKSALFSMIVHNDDLHYRNAFNFSVRQFSPLNQEESAKFDLSNCRVCKVKKGDVLFLVLPKDLFHSDELNITYFEGLSGERILRHETFRLDVNQLDTVEIGVGREFFMKPQRSH